MASGGMYKHTIRKDDANSDDDSITDGKSSEEDNDEDDIRDEASNWPYPSQLCSAHSLD